MATYQAIRAKVSELVDQTLTDIAELIVDLEAKREELEEEILDLREQLAEAESQ